MTERTQRPAPAGFVLAAGYGTRLAPLTDHVPKPLLPVGGRTLLDHALEALGRAGCRRCGVNTHHLSELIAAQVAGRTDADRIMLFHEPEILGTGGALDGAREFLGQGPDFLLHNGDVRCDVDLGALLAAHRRSSAVATLLLVDDPRFNTVAVADDGAVIDIAGLAEAGATTDSRHLTYAGIGMFERDLLEDIGPGFSSLIDPLVRALMASPGSVRSFAPPGVRWDDLGTLPRYLQAIANEGSGGDSPLAVSAITGHGSDRRFWRLSTTDWSAVAMTSPPDDPEFGRYVAIGRFLAEQDLGAPRILARHDDDRTVLLERPGHAESADGHQALGGIRPAGRAPDPLRTGGGPSARAAGGHAGCPGFVRRGHRPHPGSRHAALGDRLLP